MTTVHRECRLNGVDIRRVGAAFITSSQDIAGLPHVLSVSAAIATFDPAVVSHTRDRILQLCAGGETEIELIGPDRSAIGRVVGSGELFVPDRAGRPPLLACVLVYFDLSSGRDS